MFKKLEKKSLNKGNEVEACQQMQPWIQVKKKNV